MLLAARHSKGAERAGCLANIAEGHDKLGNKETALRFAKDALMRKADSAICRKIVHGG